MIKGKDRVKVFQDLYNSDAWKEIIEWAKEENDNSIARNDAIAARDINLNMVCEERGMRKGMRKVIRYVEVEARV